MTANPSAPSLAASSTFTVGNTVQNVGEAASRSSTTRSYLSLDSVKSAGDRLLTGSRSVPALAPGAVHSGTASVTIPTVTPLNTYFLLACADDRSLVVEGDEGNNCLVAPAAVTITGPDLVAKTVSAPPATIKRGGNFPVTDTARNLGAAASGTSKTCHYLSLDGTRSAGDKVLSASRAVSGLAAGPAIPAPSPRRSPRRREANTYVLLACVDGFDAVAETNEANNCVASGSTVTVTP